MMDTTTYYYLIGKVDHVKQGGHYRELYFDVVKYLPNLPQALQVAFVRHLGESGIQSHSVWWKDLKDFCQRIAKQVMF